MSDEPTAEERVAALERQLAELEQTHHASLLRSALRAEAVRAGMIDLDGLKLMDASELALDEAGDVVGGAKAMAAMKRSKPWLFGLPGAASSSSAASAPPAQPPRPRRATEMSHEEWRAARAELLRRL
jgi:hypothetical protein